jgi:DNA-binding NtrC family response regulator
MKWQSVCFDLNVNRTMSTISGIYQGNGSAASALGAIFATSASPAMRAVERAAMEVAGTELPIFIAGESGTGKGTLATLIHRLSKRSGRDFVKVNCQALRPALIVSNGNSFLGLNDGQLRGTVLLDEVLELEPALQAHVISMLPEADLEPDESINAPRLLAATRNEDTGLPPNSRFSLELYYRLRGVVLRIPPLRERREDIPLLAHFLLNKHAATFGRSNAQLSWRAEKQFQIHSWPGNVRELENAIKTLLAVDDEDLVLDSIGRSGAHVPEKNGSKKEHSMLEGTVSLKEASRNASRTAEKQLIREVLERTRWNRKRAARELNISYKALLYKLKQNGLSNPTTAKEQSGRGNPK